MASTRHVVPPTNLKERIAALEQRNAGNTGTDTRPTSPTPSVASSAGGPPQPAGALRDKIAKFERKGGVPVPRGRFGFGAPPTHEGPRRQGELYGNRIPAPARSVSGSVMPSRSTSPAPTSAAGSRPASPGLYSDRRLSLTLSSVMSDDEGIEYSPISSPTFAFPPESPESVLSATFTPEASPSSLSAMGEPATFKPAFIRGTSFQKAMEVARNAENAKLESQRPESLFIERQITGRGWVEPDLPKVVEQWQEPAKEEVEEHKSTKLETEKQVLADDPELPVPPKVQTAAGLPAKVDSTQEPTKVEEPTQELAKVEPELHAVAIMEAKVPEPAKAEAQVPEPAQGCMDDPTRPKPQLPLDDVKVEVEAPKSTPAIVVSSEESTPVVVQDSPAADPPLAVSPPSALVIPETQPEKVTSTPSEPAIAEAAPVQVALAKPAVAKTAVFEAPPSLTEPTFVKPVVADVVPLIIRRRSPTNSVSVKTEAKEETLPRTESPSKKVEPVQAVPVPSVVIRPASVEAVKQPTQPSSLESKPRPTVFERPKEQPVQPVFEDAIAETKSKASPTPEELNSSPQAELPIPDIVVENETAEAKASSDDKAEAVGRNKAGLTLDAQRLVDDSLMSPPMATGNMTAMSLTDVLSNYFAGGGVPNDSLRTTTPPPVPDVRSPLSPLATLAYDAPQSPPPAKPATVKVPDPQSLLSPPASGFLSAAPSSGNSSFGSIGSRPMSMIETSPGQVSRALRMTPATSRGVPMFLPPSSSQPRKSDFVYFPPTPDAEVTEFGSVVLNPEHRRRGSEPDLKNPRAKPATFSAIVHGKVRETPTSATMPLLGRRALPPTPQMKKVKRATILEPPLSPGQGELVALLHEAVLLEDALDKGELPSEVPRISEEDEQAMKKEEEAAALAARAQQEEEERQRIALATAQLQAKRDQPTAGRLKHTFLVPLSKARSMHHRKETSSSAASTLQTEERIVRPKSAGVVEQSHSGIRSAKADLSTMPRMPLPPRPPTPSDNSTTTVAPQVPAPPPKSPKSSRFAPLRRLGSLTARPNTVHGDINRTSNSTSSEISSEDSALAVTPPENNLEFGVRVSPVSESSGHSHGHSSSHHGHAQKSSMSFPSISPKRSVSRATSFAEKMWSRARTKSNGSVLSSTSTDRTTEEGAPKLPAFGVPPAIQLPPSLISSSASTSQEDVRVVQPAKRSTSLQHRSDLPPIPVSPPPPLPTITSSSCNTLTPTRPSDLSNDSLLLSPSKDTTRPSSWTSVSSAGSLPSPLFDKALFDAFPSVPGTTPTPMTAFPYSRLLQRDMSLGSAANATSSFDSALLSSAIHLASSHKSTATPPTTYQPLPSARAPSTATYAPRRSGETAR